MGDSKKIMDNKDTPRTTVNFPVSIGEVLRGRSKHMMRSLSSEVVHLLEIALRIPEEERPDVVIPDGDKRDFRIPVAIPKEMLDRIKDMIGEERRRVSTQVVFLVAVALEKTRKSDERAAKAVLKAASKSGS